jgi:ATP-binding cassette subfamily B protein
MLACAVVAVVTNVAANRMAGRVARDATRRIRHDLFARSALLSCAQVDSVTIPSLESLLTTDTYNIYQMLGQVQRMGVRAPILLIGGILITMRMEPVLSLVLVAMLPFAGVLVFWVSRKGIPLYAGLQRAIDRMVRTARENIGGIRVVKALSKIEYEKQRFDQVNAEVACREQRAGSIMAATNPGMSLMLNLGLTLVILLGAYRVNLGLTQTGKIIAFLSYFTIILTAMQSVTRIFVVLSKAGASADRISAILNLPADLRVEPLPEGHAAAAGGAEPCHILFENVSFAYPNHKRTLHGISFALKRGETLGIIGPTGCGKSTILQLLMRLYDVESGDGRIEINGIPIRSIPKEELHTMFGVVFQNDALFADSIAENIDFGRSLPERRLERAAKDAQAWPFISELGLAHRLTSRGTNVSGGQKQRILIARALAAKPEILVLDDSSSALDYRTDAALRRAVRKSCKGSTAVIVAQRVSSILHADRILVLGNGRALCYGSHGELLECCAEYREIYQAQMGGGGAA